MKKFSVITLGCRLNQAESQEIADLLIGSGWEKASSAKMADLLIINSCVVTQKAEKETRQSICRLKRINPRARLIVAGCWVDKLKLLGGIKPGGVDLMLSNGQKWRVLINKQGSKGRGLKRFRKLVKIQTGCSNACAYCVTRLIRGKPKSRPVKEVIKEINAAVEQGVLEVVLTGINISQYDDQGKTWLDLIETILKETKIKLIRLGSINPRLVETCGKPEQWARKLLKIYQGAGRDRLAKHLHLSLQSGSNKILRLMKRNYTIQDFQGVANILRRAENLNLSTDIIVGFPGETELDFQKTINVAKKIAFGKIHIFRFSARPGTLAKLKQEDWGIVPEGVKKERAKRLAEIEKGLRHDFYRSQVGKELMAIVWQDHKGLTDNYIPIFYPTQRRKLPAVFKIKLSQAHLL